MRTVTYGVSGLIDWNAQISVGRARLSVHFSGGAITKYGVTPAEYTTADPITQRLIEDSDYYRSGKIRILRSSGRADPVALSRKTDLATREAYQAATLPFDEPLPSAQPSSPVGSGARSDSLSTTQPPSPVGTGARSDSDQSLTFACIEDARQYLMDKYKVPSLAIRTIDSVTNIAAEHGLTIKIEHP